MRPLRLARIAIEAEALRLRLLLHRAAIRAVLAGFSVALLLSAVVFGHAAAWYWLREFLPGHQAALIFAGADLLLAVLLLALAARSAPGQAEREALAVRRRALDDASETFRISALLIRLVDLLAASRPGR